MRIRRILFVLIVIGLLVIGGGYCLNLSPGLVDQDHPDVVTRAAIEAIGTMDAESVTAYFTPLPSRSMSARLNTTFNYYDSIEISGLTTRIALDDGVAAQVRADYDMIVTKDGNQNIQHCSKVIKLVQIDGKWWINEAF